MRYIYFDKYELGFRFINDIRQGISVEVRMEIFKKVKLVAERQLYVRLTRTLQKEIEEYE